MCEAKSRARVGLDEFLLDQVVGLVRIGGNGRGSVAVRGKTKSVNRARE